LTRELVLLSCKPLLKLHSDEGSSTRKQTNMNQLKEEKVRMLKRNDEVMELFLSRMDQFSGSKEHQIETNEEKLDQKGLFQKEETLAGWPS
jgi:hypothetical protein